MGSLASENCAAVCASGRSQVAYGLVYMLLLEYAYLPPQGGMRTSHANRAGKWLKPLTMLLQTNHQLRAYR